MSSLFLSTKKHEYTLGRSFCLKHLRAGDVETFLELFNLIKGSRRRLKEAELREERYPPELLEHQPPKLKLMSKCLRKCEIASRAGDTDSDCQMRLTLGRLFHKEFWLAEHFYKSSYRVLSKAKVIENKRMIMVLENLACLMEKKGAWKDALNMLEEAFNLAEEHSLEMTDDIRQSMYLTTHRICMKMGQKSLEEEEENLTPMDGEKSESLKLFKRALEMAEFAGAEDSCAVAHANIGKIMLLLGNNNAAIEHFHHLLNSCIHTGDKLGLSNGYLALYSVYENMEDKEMMLSTLNKCKEIALENNYVEVLVPYYIAVGQRDTKEDNYQEAYKQFKVAYEILEENKTQFPNYTEVEKLIRVCVGIAKAHLTFGHFTGILSFNSTKALMKLMDWKNNGIGFNFNNENITDEVVDTEITTASSQ